MELQAEKRNVDILKTGALMMPRFNIWSMWWIPKITYKGFSRSATLEKSPPQGLILDLLGNIDLKLDLKNRWLKYVLRSDLCLKGLSLPQIYELEALDLASQSSKRWLQLLQHNCLWKLCCEGKRGLLPTKICCNKLQADGETDGNVEEWSSTGLLAEVLATSFLLSDLQYGQRYSWREYYY